MHRLDKFDRLSALSSSMLGESSRDDGLIND